VRSEDSDGGLAWQRACVSLGRWLAGNGAAYSHRLTASGVQSLIYYYLYFMDLFLDILSNISSDLILLSLSKVLWFKKNLFFGSLEMTRSSYFNG